MDGAALSASLHKQRNPMFGTKADGRVHGDLRRRARQQAEAPVPDDGREREHALHPRESFADALTAARSERKEGKARTYLRVLLLGGEALRIEAKRIGEEARIAMHNEL